ncbi:MAG: PBSX family phage terminase large subunit [Desulfuromonadales bacterium]|nr:PBSX family phage terminase large subunit [Desulfuromonadales bacterium]
MNLDWRPQEAFAEYFYTDPAEIIRHKTVFQEGIENFVSYGGRGSAKTWTWVDAVVVEASLRSVRILVTRELQNSIEESIKAEIENTIDERGLGHFFRVLKTEITALNGSKFIFKGLKNNITNLKSIADVDIVLCEEAENITKNSWDKLLPSIRPRSGRAPIVIVIFNPELELDDTYQRWVTSPPPETISKLINWRDNKHFPEHLNKQRLHFKKTRPLRDYEHVWEGKPTGPDGEVIIDLEWIKAARFASRHELFKRVGDRVVGYDPAGQGKDSNAVVYVDGNIVKEIDEWVRSDDLRKATQRAFGMALRNKANCFRFDVCGGLGDGVDVFVADEKEEHPSAALHIEVAPFDAGSHVVGADDLIPGTDKTWGDTYTNAKAQAHGIMAQLLYNTYRFIVLGETDMLPEDMLSIDIEDDDQFNKLARELSTPLWVKSNTNSKKKVEAKKDMEKRTGQPSPNTADGLYMIKAPQEAQHIAMAW